MVELRRFADSQLPPSLVMRVWLTAWSTLEYARALVGTVDESEVGSLVRDVVDGREHVSCLDGRTRTRIETPVRGSACQHLQVRCRVFNSPTDRPQEYRFRASFESCFLLSCLGHRRIQSRKFMHGLVMIS